MMKLRWIKSLENGEFSKNYVLKEVPFQGEALETVKKYSFLIVSTLQNMGINKENDQKRILKHIEILVEKYSGEKSSAKEKKKKHKKSKKQSDENPESGSSDDYPESASSDEYPE